VPVEGDERSGGPNASKTTETIHELADTIGISYGVCQEILTENLNMCCIAAKFVLRLLTNDQKQWCVNLCRELQEKVNADPNHKWYSTALRKIAFMVLLKLGRNDGISVYVPKETVLKETAAKIFFYVVWKLLMDLRICHQNFS
jgi:hypothetical protein